MNEQSVTSYSCFSTIWAIMSWFSVNLDLLFRTCFALDSESQSSEQKKQHVNLSNLPNHHWSPATSTTTTFPSSSSPSKTVFGKNFRLPSPSLTEKTESVLSFSTLAESSAYTGSSATALDTIKGSRKRKKKRLPTHQQALDKEGLVVSGLLSSGRFGCSFLAKYSKKEVDSQVDSNGYVTLNAYHKTVLTDTYQQHIPHREWALLETLDHPFITKMVGSFSDRNCLYLMSPVEVGGPLSHVLRNALCYGVTDNMKIFYAACVLSVLKYAHNKNILHRGLHPDSLLVDASGYLKVTDWGFAKEVTDRTYTLCGHVEYLCPEAIVQDSGYAKGADYWALGVLIYEMFVGRSAFVPSSLDFKYDVNFEDRVLIGTGTSSAHSRGSGSDGSDGTAGREDLEDPQGYDTGTIENILTKEPIYPSYMSHLAKSIVQGLCQKNVTQRLGTRRGGRGIEDIQMHIFFQDIQWSRLNKKMVVPPWTPTLDGKKKPPPSNPSVEELCARYYPSYLPSGQVKKGLMIGPEYSGYNCPDWNSFQNGNNSSTSSGDNNKIDLNGSTKA